MTKELFWENAYMQKCTARVQEASEGKFIVLDQSIFFPQGGGQPSDKGTLKCNGEVFNLMSAKRTGEKISLEVDKEGLKTGDTVECELDWKRRYALMRMHTSAHVLSQVIFLELGSLSTGNQLEETQSRMDFNVANYSQELVHGLIGKANEVLAQGLEVKTEFVKREKALARPELFKLKDVAPKDLQEFRLVSIGGFDVQADGGTHVKNTREVGKIKFLRAENKGKENRRIYWTLE